MCCMPSWVEMWHIPAGRTCGARPTAHAGAQPGVTFSLLTLVWKKRISVSCLPVLSELLKWGDCVYYRAALGEPKKGGGGWRGFSQHNRCKMHCNKKCFNFSVKIKNYLTCCSSSNSVHYIHTVYAFYLYQLIAKNSDNFFILIP